MSKLKVARYYCHVCKMWHGSGGEPMTLNQAKAHFAERNENPDKHQAVPYREAQDILSLIAVEAERATPSQPTRDVEAALEALETVYITHPECLKLTDTECGDCYGCLLRKQAREILRSLCQPDVVKVLEKVVDEMRDVCSCKMSEWQMCKGVLDRATEQARKGER